MNRLILREVAMAIHAPERMGQKLSREFSRLDFNRPLGRISQGQSDLDTFTGKTIIGPFAENAANEPKPRQGEEAYYVRHIPNLLEYGRICADPSHCPR